jgi:hypothetical protein
MTSSRKKIISEVRFYLILILLCLILGYVINLIYNPGARQVYPEKRVFIIKGQGPE